MDAVPNWRCNYNTVRRIETVVFWYCLIKQRGGAIEPVFECCRSKVIQWGDVTQSIARWYTIFNYNREWRIETYLLYMVSTVRKMEAVLIWYCTVVQYNYTVWRLEAVSKRGWSSLVANWCCMPLFSLGTDSKIKEGFLNANKVFRTFSFTETYWTHARNRLGIFTVDLL